MATQKKLKDIISNGIVNDLFEAEEALLIDKLVGENAQAINEATFGRFFNTIQRYLSRSFLLYLARIFEWNSEEHELRSIPTALKTMREHSEDLIIQQKHILIEFMIGAGYEEDINTLEDHELTKLVAKHFREAISEKTSPSTYDAIKTVKTIRNKHIAHNEVIESDNLPRVLYEEIYELIELAKVFVSVIGESYFNVDYILTEDVKKASFSLERLLKKATILS